MFKLILTTIILTFLFTPVSSSKQSSTKFTVEGTAKTLEKAKMECYKTAILKYLKANFSKDVLQSNRDKILSGIINKPAMIKSFINNEGVLENNTVTVKNDDGDEEDQMSLKMNIFLLGDDLSAYFNSLTGIKKTDQKTTNTTVQNKFVDTTYSQFSEINKTADTTAGTSYLTLEERKVIYYCNLARMNGPLFAKTFLTDYIKTKKIKENSYTKSLFEDLKKLAALKPLEPAQDLYDASKLHAVDMGKTGKTGHNSSAGKNFSARMSGLTSKYMGTGENCSYGYEGALDIVFQLLIDDGVASLGHRKNILNGQFKYVGVSIAPHKQYRFNCVMDFGNGK